MQTPLRYFAYPSFIVLLVGLGFWYFRLGPGFSQSIKEKNVETGKDYYLSVSLIEVSEQDPTGASWDSLSESGPDIYVEIHWRGNRIYRSTTKADTFIAKWSNAELNFRQIAISGNNMSMDDIIRAARVNIRQGEFVEIKVFDEDVLVVTAIGEKRLELEHLKIGDNLFAKDLPAGVRRLNVRVLDMSDPVDPLG